MRGYDKWHWETDERERSIMEQAIGSERDASTSERDALKDIAYDCGSLEAAQRRAKDALKNGK